MQPRTPYAFVADSTLGRLARNLRLAGFDTLLDRGAPDASRLAGMSGAARIVLTRSARVQKALGRRRSVLIRENGLQGQMMQVLAQFGLKKEDLQPLTRCALCNRPLEPLSKEHSRGRVPDYVWQSHGAFKECLDCRRVYWPGSHAERFKQRLALLLAP